MGALEAVAPMSSEGQVPDLGALLSQLGAVQQHLQDAQASATSAVIEGVAGGGAVRVTATGGLDVTKVVIDPAVVDPADVDLLQDLVLAAVRDVVEQAQALQSTALDGAGLGGGLEGLLGG